MSRSPNWARFAIGLAALIPLAAPAAASAVVSPVEEAGRLTVNSDEAADRITLTSNGDVLVVNGNPTGELTDGNVEIVVNAGEGADVVDAGSLVATDYKSLVVNGGEGEDVITGGANGAIEDVLNGDGGDDRLTGFKGDDEVSGGDGDDVMIWNNGEGADTDSNDGGPGNDEVLINGSNEAGDQFTYKAGAAVGQAQLNRPNLAAFEIDVTSSERMTLNGLAGDDTIGPDPAVPTGVGMAATKIALALNGGGGDDSLAGGDGADLVNGEAGDDVLSGNAGVDSLAGGDDADTLSGDAGNDRLVGDRGGDTANGNDGDDVLVWNNGDGSDVNDGGAGFDRAEENGSPAAADAFKLVPAGSGAIFERTNLVAFTVKFIAGIEEVAVNPGFGDDSFVVSGGLSAFSVTADGGSGNDTLTGAEEADSFFGGSGNDVLTPGAGSDLADGGDGEDRLLSRDNIGDLVRGGGGVDTAQTDAPTVDAVNGVETVDATATPTKPGPDVTAQLPQLGKVSVAGKGNKLTARIPVSCPAAEAGGCRTTLTLETAKSAKLGSVRAIVVLGSKSVRLAAGKKATLSIRLAPGAAGLAKGGKLAARMRIASTDAAGNSASRRTTLNLRLPRP